MKLGAFSISLSVKNLAVSKEFYQNLGFHVFAGTEDQKYLIMKNESSLIGLFEGMFEGNLLTFNPGWDTDANALENFDDVCEIQDELKAADIRLTSEVSTGANGPGSITLSDPDGNIILIDQHI